jgi:hypothetical protein
MALRGGNYDHLDLPCIFVSDIVGVDAVLLPAPDHMSVKPATSTTTATTIQTTFLFMMFSVQFIGRRTSRSRARPSNREGAYS